MATGIPEEALLHRALARGLLSASDVRAVDNSEPTGSDATPSTRFGPRLDRLVQKGRIAPEAIEQLIADSRAELVAQTIGDPPEGSSGPRNPSWGSGSSLQLSSSDLNPATGLDLAIGDTMAGSAAPAPLPPAAAPFPVMDWARYEFLSLLGQGGMGAVYKARDRRLGRLVALKFVRGGDPHLAIRFLQEARAQARIDHPGVCEVYEVGEVDGKSFIAMRYVDGKPLDKLRPLLSLDEKVLILAAVAEAVHAAHKLGIIHRDLKPSNIMVERGEDGRWQPIVMDFGLAREANENRGLTESGAVMGTPAYMSPEQARGDNHNLDRRADIYSLGATLYDLILGVPPFEDQSVVNVLLRVLNEDPTPPRTILPSLPPNLETIILKCLSKEPAQRYDSALALAEDLQRHIKVEPILARRASLRYRLRRFVLRHRALVAVSTISLLAILGLAGYSLRSRILAQRERARAAQRAAAQAQLAQQLAQDVKDIEWLLRSAYQLPLHDIGHEQVLTRRRMVEMEAQLRKLDPGDVGYIHYAIGRGHLALHELEPARAALLRARENGVELPDLHYALGAVLGQLYQKELIEARRHGDKGWLAARQKQLEVQYLLPALTSLERSHGAKLDSPDLLASLVAWYRKQYDVALAKAKLTAVDSPWLYEARKLEGDVYLEQASEQRGHGNYQGANENLKLAITAYEAAANIGRSDATVYQAISEAWIQQSQLDSAQGKSPTVALQNALTACEKSNISAPQDGTGYTKKSYAHFWLAWEKLISGKDPRPDIELLLTAGENAVRLNHSDEVAYDAIGNGYWVRGNYERDIGQDPSESWNKAIHMLGQAIAVAPKFPWAVNDLGLVYQERAQWLVSKSLDPEPDFKLAISSFRKAIDIHPEYISAYNNLVLTYASFAQYQVAHGRDVSKQLQEASRAAENASAISKSIPNLRNNLALAKLQMAKYLLDTKQDPSVLLTDAEKDLAASREINPNDDVNSFVHGSAMLLAAKYQLLQRKSPTLFLQTGQADVQRVVEKNPSEADFHLLACRLRLVEAEWAHQQGLPTTMPLRLALADARRAVSLSPTSADALTELARVLLAQSVATSPRPLLSLLTEALSVTDRALSLQNDLPQGHAIRGALLLRKAEQLVSTDEKQRMLQSAEESLARALAQNPLLRHDYESDRRRVASLLTQKPVQERR